MNPFNEGIKDFLDLIGAASVEEVTDPDLIEILSDIQANVSHFNVVANHYNVEGFCATYKHSTAERWAFIMPDSGDFKLRIQEFGKDGLIGHHCFNSESKLLESLVRDGYTSPAAKNTFTEFQQTDQWEKGTQRLLLIQELNLGRINYEQFTQQMRECAA